MKLLADACQGTHTWLHGAEVQLWDPCLCFTFTVAKTVVFAIEMVQVSENKIQAVCKADFG